MSFNATLIVPEIFLSKTNGNNIAKATTPQIETNPMPNLWSVVFIAKIIKNNDTKTVNTYTYILYIQIKN